jgi:MmyB-like transcription regulator ligand binding domain
MSTEDGAGYFLSAFSDPQKVAQYADGPRRFVPGFADLHRMTGILLAERASRSAKVLVLGAGGGLELQALWRANDVHGYGEGVKRLRHPILGPISFEYSAFAVDGRPDLGMVVYNPATPQDAERVRSLIESRSARAGE